MSPSDVVAVVVVLGLTCDLVADIAHCSSTYTTKLPLLLTQLRLIAASAFIALLSVHEQAVGIVGVRGLLPLRESLMAISTIVDSKAADDCINAEGSAGYLRSSLAEVKSCCRSVNIFMMKMVLLFMKPCATSDQALLQQVRIALIVSIVAVVVPHPVCFLYLYFYYYSVWRVFGKFMRLQWDLLLLECLCLSALTSIVPLIASGSCGVSVTLCLSCFKLLLFRLMFGSGAVKVLSGDSSWADLTAMSYHFLSQPLPSSAAPLLHRLPRAVLRAVTLLSLVAETVVPVVGLFAGVLPAPADNALTLTVLGVYTALQVGIMGSGHFGFFNALSLALGASLLSRYEAAGAAAAPVVGPINYAELLLGAAAASHLAAVGLHALYGLLSRYGLRESSALLRCLAALQRVSVVRAANKYFSDRVLAASKVMMIGNHYGLFATMTKGRFEVVLETSVDNNLWQAVHFKYKPSEESCQLLSPLAMRPPLHMPRLDWEMWFFGLQAHRSFVTSGGKTCAVPLPLWVARLLLGVAAGDESVLGLLKGSSSGEFVRMTLYSFEFSDSNSSYSWRRRRIGEVLPSTPVARVRDMVASELPDLSCGMGERPKVESKEELIARTLRKLATGGRK